MIFINFIVVVECLVMFFNISIYFLGGKIMGCNWFIVGVEVVWVIEELYVYFCFINVLSLYEIIGLMSNNWDIVIVK